MSDPKLRADDQAEASPNNGGLRRWAHRQRRIDACSSTIENQAIISKQRRASRQRLWLTSPNGKA